MFNLSNWLHKNLIQACRERSFTVAQVNLMAFNYYNKGQLTEDDFNAVKVVTAEVQAEIEREQTERQEQTEEQQEPTEPIEKPSIDEPIIEDDGEYEDIPDDFEIGDDEVIEP